MRNRTAFRTVALVVLIALARCATYVPPPPATPQDFSRTMNASYDRTWSAITYVAGASFFKIKAFEKASGLMTLDFELKDVLPYVECGGAVNASTHTTQPALLALGFVGFALSGTANITIRSEGARRTEVQFNSHYTLVGFRRDASGVPFAAAQWQFNSGTSDTQNILGTMVVCRPSYKIEHDFLSEVSARL